MAMPFRIEKLMYQPTYWKWRFIEECNAASDWEIAFQEFEFTKHCLETISKIDSEGIGQ